jgi:hypothetical protein
MSPKVLSCNVCGRLFQSLGPGYCPICAEAMDKAFAAVKEYLYMHEDATVVDIIKDAGVAEKYVLDFLKEGRLNIGSAQDILKCEDCGRPIPSGRYCDGCRDKLASALSSVVTKEKNGPKQAMQVKMHARYGRD